MNALDDFTRKCSLWRDEFLLEELDKGPAGYAHLEYFAVIQAEAVRRGLPLSPTPLVLDAPAPPPQGSLVRRLWRGEVSAARYLGERNWRLLTRFTVALAVLAGLFLFAPVVRGPFFSLLPSPAGALPCWWLPPLG